MKLAASQAQAAIAPLRQAHPVAVARAACDQHRKPYRRVAARTAGEGVAACGRMRSIAQAQLRVERGRLAAAIANRRA